MVESPEQPITGSFWGDSEAGIVANDIYVRRDTPIHSLLHEACHTVCMDEDRRSDLDRDARASGRTRPASDGQGPPPQRGIPGQEADGEPGWPVDGAPRSDDEMNEPSTTFHLTVSWPFWENGVAMGRALRGADAGLWPRLSPYTLLLLTLTP
jgi:hypothetical protein